jgi:hypothetical protein
MNRDPTWFTVRLALTGIFEEQAAEEMQALEYELSMRPHLRNSRVSWETKSRRAIVQVDTEDLESGLAGEQVAEELLEIASGVLSDFEIVSVDVLDVCPSK